MATFCVHFWGFSSTSGTSQWMFSDPRFWESCTREARLISMSGLDPCYFPIISPGTDGGDKPFCHDERFVTALDRLNSTGETRVLDALHLDEREAGFSATRTGLFRVTKQAPNEARIGLSRPRIVSLSLAPSMRLCLSSLRHPCLFCDRPLSALTHLLTASPLQGKSDSGMRERHR